MGLLFRVCICIVVLATCVYSIINEQNKITQLRLEIPHVTKAIQELEEESTRLRFEIDSFENPLHLMQLARLSEYSHLKHPLNKDVVSVAVMPLQEPVDHVGSQEIQIPSKLSLATLLFQEELTRQ